MIKVTQKDAIRSEQLTPGWREGTCTNHFEKPASTDGSIVHNFEIEVIDPNFPVPVPIKNFNVSEKAISMGKNFFIACGLPKDIWDKLIKGEETFYEIEPRNCIGKKFKVFVKNTTFEGRINNEASDFMALTT